MAAAVVGGMVASGIIKVVIKEIGSAAMGKFKRHKSLTKDLGRMKMTLESLEAALSDAERRSITDRAALLWVNRLKDAMYEISDMLNEYESDDTNMVRTIGKRISMPNKIKKMQECLQKITDDRKNYSLPPETCTNEMKLPDIRENAGNVIEAEIFGRTKEKSDFLAHLFECCTDATTYGPIWGFGGIGKSTFAKLLYNDSCFKGYSRVWVYVSQMFDLKKIGNTIISQLSGKQDQQLDDLHSISIRLQKLLVEKRNTLIVLDDLWENHPSQLADLKAMLKQGEGCKVIVVVTTRNEGIANEIGTAQPYNLPQLSDEMCWEIIRQKSKFETRNDQERLEPIGREIAKKCKGVALGAQALGHMLKSKAFREWNWVSNNDIWSLSTSVDTLPRHEVLGSLLLSYNIMPPHLKLCFAYCGIFPKGCKMIKADLIHLWIALEFVEPSDTFSSWQLGESYVVQLLKMPFLQHSKADTQPAFIDDGHTLFVMHDLVHDLARSVMADEFDLAGPNCRYAWLTDCTKRLKSCMTSPEKLRAVHIVDYKDETEFLQDAFSAATNLRILDLRCYCLKEVPTSVGQLKHLRYFRAPQIYPCSSLSCISMLQGLNYLNLCGCTMLVVLPESICEMKNLMHLDLSKCGHLKELPHSFGKLKALIYLNLALCHRLNGIPESLTELTKLQHLNLSSCQNLRGLQDIIGSLTELRYLNLAACIYYIFDSPSPNEVESFIDRICNLPCMEELNLSFNKFSIVSIPESVTFLRKLVLEGCSRITSLPECVAKLDDQTLFGLLPKLDVFAVIDDMKCSNNLGLLEHVNPDQLDISDLQNVWSREEAVSIKLSEKQNMRELTLRWSDPEVFEPLDDNEILAELVPPSTLHLFAIHGYASEIFPDWLMSIGSYLPNVVRLQLVGLHFCDSLPPVTQLPNLRELTLKDMYSLEEWDTSPFFSGEAAVNELISCMLEQVNIHGCPKLRIAPQLPRAASWSIIKSDNVFTSWPESVSQNGASSSSSAAGPINLAVEDIEVPLHQWRLLHHVPDQSHLHITRCSDLTSSAEITRALQSFKSLKLEEPVDGGHRDYDKLPDWLGGFHRLRKDTTTNCRTGLVT